MKRIIKIWFKMAKMVILPDLVNPGAIILFVIGKIVRIAFYFVFIFSIASVADNILSYSREEMILFFLIFVLVDGLIQLFFRGVYVFRPLVISGNFDLELLKPLPSYFRPILGQFDLADFITMVPFIGFTAWFIAKNNLIDGLGGLLIFLIMLAVSFLIAFAFHLFVCSVCILTMEIDHLIWVYRDLTAMARFPTDIYRGLVKFVLTFILPVTILMTFPAKALLGLLSPFTVLFSFIFGLTLVYLSLRFWSWSLKRYTSASS